MAVYNVHKIAKEISDATGWNVPSIAESVVEECKESNPEDPLDVLNDVLNDTKNSLATREMDHADLVMSTVKEYAKFLLESEEEKETQVPVDYSQYECPYSHLEKECGHELHGPEGYENTYGVWCSCGFRGPVFYLSPKDLKLKKKISKDSPSA